MSRLFALRCPSCSGQLNLPAEVRHVTCSYCGTASVVEESGGALWLSVAGELSGVRAGVDRTAAELAVIRLPKEIEEQRRIVEQLRAQLWAPLEAELTARKPTQSRWESPSKPGYLSLAGIAWGCLLIPGMVSCIGAVNLHGARWTLWRQVAAWGLGLYGAVILIDLLRQRDYRRRDREIDTRNQIAEADHRTKQERWEAERRAAWHELATDPPAHLAAAEGRLRALEDQLARQREILNGPLPGPWTAGRQQ